MNHALSDAKYLLPPCPAPPKYFLPPYPTSARAKFISAKAELMSAIEQLEANDCGHETLRLLANIAISVLWSEEYHQKVKDLGMSAALEVYDTATMNAEYETTEADPDNPRNWESYRD